MPQGVQAVLPGGDAEPSAQGRQSAAAALPLFALNVLAGQRFTTPAAQ